MIIFCLLVLQFIELRTIHFFNKKKKKKYIGTVRTFMYVQHEQNGENSFDCNLGIKWSFHALRYSLIRSCMDLKQKAKTVYGRNTKNIAI